MIHSVIPTAMSLTINKYISDVLQQKKKQIKIVPLISIESFIELMEERLRNYEKMDWDYRVLLEQDDFILSRFFLKRELNVRTINDNFLALQRGSMLYIITGGSKYFIDSGIMFLAKRLRPKVIIAYITSNEIYELLKHFSETKRTKLNYKSAVRKKMFGPSETDVSYKIGRRQKKPVDFEEAFKKAERMGLWIDKIHVYSERENYDFYLSRDGIIKFRKGSFEDYYSSLLLKIKEKYFNRLKIFENRSRKTLPAFTTQPLLLSFNTNIFDDITNRRQFINMIEEYKDCSYSIVHAGNPYVHIIIVDRIDNSVFSVRTKASQNIIISPQIKTTEASLMRFTKHLFDNFREAEIGDLRVYN